MSAEHNQMLATLRAHFLARRDHYERAFRGDFRRPEEWFIEQRRSLADLSRLGAELKLIAANAESYEAWKASLPEGSSP